VAAGLGKLFENRVGFTYGHRSRGHWKLSYVVIFSTCHVIMFHISCNPPPLFLVTASSRALAITDAR